MINFKDIFYENLKLTQYVKTTYDDFQDKNITQSGYKFHVKYSDGASAFGTIFDDVANIVDIRAPKDSDLKTIRGSKTYQRVIEDLKQQGVKTINVNLQSADSRIAIEKLLKMGILKNPRNKRGISVDEYFTTFDIDKF